MLELNSCISLNDKDYRLEKLLGKGKGGYSYLASCGGKFFVLKQIHHEPCSYYQFGNKIMAELNDYERLKNADIRIPLMIAHDVQNERILKEYIDGPTIEQFAKEKLVKPEYIAQVEEMCRKLYPLHLNIDYYPTNFIVQNGLLYYIDYECNEYSDEWNFENWGKKYWR
ncbi:hypothetical protein [uncultured Treponema sp.]|uniref:hypothetical protein n=1 Tax=uncultured Treponema sp. TaxID=162155 RepID=UPI00259A86F0|nr:hypothetical protein [uncultured Treponema sp.]